MQGCNRSVAFPPFESEQVLGIGHNMNHSDVRKYLRPASVAGAAATLVVLSACATYQSHPLEDQSPLTEDLAELSVAATTLRGAAASHVEINMTDGLDLTEVGILAVINNPELRIQRARLEVAGAQAFAAGLLPDPQISAGFDKPTGNSAPTTAWALGLGYDIMPLITRQARLDAARREQDKVRLDLLWQEWQVIQQARSLAVRMLLEQQRLALLNTMRTRYLTRYQRSAQALTEGDITLDVNGTDLTALVDTLSQISQLEQVHNQTSHAFNLLLGLKPQVIVNISPLSQVVLLDARTVSARLADLPQTRPDLLALKAGYESQEARVRAAILAQFPSLGIGTNRARDTGNVNTIGLSINLTLPLFNGNRGNIAIERATREQLRAEYQTRLAQTSIDADRLLQLQDILGQQQLQLQTYLPHLKRLVDRARQAYLRGDIQALTFVNMESTWVNKRLEQINLVQAAWETRIALEALLALPGYPQAVVSKPTKDQGVEL